MIEPGTMNLGWDGSDGICVAWCVSGSRWAYMCCGYIVAQCFCVCVSGSDCVVVLCNCVCRTLCVDVRLRPELAWSLDVWLTYASPPPPIPQWVELVTKAPLLGRGGQVGTLALPS